MATDAQIAANRRNSQKSTGPRSDAGKAASSRNALRSGLYAESRIIDREDPADYDDLSRDYFDSCRPESPVEAALVAELVESEWLLRRMRATETQLWNEDIAERRNSPFREFDPNTALAMTFHRTCEKLNILQRRISALSRQYHRALHDLSKIQSARPKPAEPPATAAAPPAEIGFVPSNSSAPDTPLQPSATSAPPPPRPFGFVPPISGSRRAPNLPTPLPAPSPQPPTPAPRAARANAPISFINPSALLHLQNLSATLE